MSEPRQRHSASHHAFGVKEDFHPRLGAEISAGDVVAYTGGDRLGDELPAELQRRETRPKKIRAAKRGWRSGHDSRRRRPESRAQVLQAKPAAKSKTISSTRNRV
jgi:hypothetical protein